MPRFTVLADEAKLLLDHESGLSPSTVAFLHRVLMCRKDLERYQWIRERFDVRDIRSDGTYRPGWPVVLPRAATLDDSIDISMKGRGEDDEQESE